MSRNAHNGFTLIELMITVAVLTILVGIAIPAYQQFIVRGKRSAAQSAMMDIANREQQFLLANRAYADKATLEANGYALAAELRESYTYTVDTAMEGGRPTFLITFTGINGQAQDNSPNPLTLNSSGTKAPLEKWRR